MVDKRERGAAREGRLTVSMLRKSVIESRYEGHLTAALIDRVHPEFLALLASGRPEIWIADATAVKGYDPAVGFTGAQWIREFKANGGRTFLVIADSTPLRMLATTAGFAAGLKLEVLSTRAEALSRIADRS